MKRHPTEWEYIFANQEITIQNIYFLKVLQLNNKQPNLNMGEGLEQIFLQVKYTDGQQAHEKV